MGKKLVTERMQRMVLEKKIKHEAQAKEHVQSNKSAWQAPDPSAASSSTMWSRDSSAISQPPSRNASITSDSGLRHSPSSSPKSDSVESDDLNDRIVIVRQTIKIRNQTLQLVAYDGDTAESAARRFMNQNGLSEKQFPVLVKAIRAKMPQDDDVLPLTHTHTHTARQWLAV
jgi:hypothetical protein